MNEENSNDFIVGVYSGMKSYLHYLSYNEEKKLLENNEIKYEMNGNINDVFSYFDDKILFCCFENEKNLKILKLGDDVSKIDNEENFFVESDNFK